MNGVAPCDGMIRHLLSCAVTILSSSSSWVFVRSCSDSRYLSDGREYNYVVNTANLYSFLFID